VVGRARRPYSPPSSATPSTGRVQVPRIITDVVASLRPWPIEVTVADTQVVIPAYPAADWLSVLMVDDLRLDDMLLALAPDVADTIDEALFSGSLSFDDYSDLILNIITTAAGRPWHKALRLITTVQASWDVIGADLEQRGIDADRCSLSAWLDVALVTLLKHLDEKDIPLFVTRLEAPLPGNEEEEMTMSADDFAALMAEQ